MGDGNLQYFTEHEMRGLGDAVSLLRDGREAVLRDWVDRVRANQAMQTGQALTEPLLLDHIPNLYDAILDRLEISRSRDEAEQFATVHGFARRLSGYDITETVLEMLMLRRAVWAHLIAIGARVDAAYAAMEQIDGMLDRAILASLSAHLDPTATFLKESLDGDVDAAQDGRPAAGAEVGEERAPA